MAKKKLIALVGPTAAGKSKVAFEIVRKIDGEIVSADSMQVYQELNIGTAKPDEKERQEVRYHLIDVISLEDVKNGYRFTVSQYQKMARECIDEIIVRGKSPILVGGSGLYIRAVIDNLKFAPQNIEIRKKIYEDVEKDGLGKVYQRLEKIDPESAEKIDKKNLRRIVRALEIFEISKIPFSRFYEDWEKRESIYDLKMIGLDLPREILYEKINERLDSMINKGLISEVEGLIKKNYREALQETQALGYREIIEWLEEKATWPQTVEKIKRKTRQFAKRQLTWFRKDPRIIWLNPLESNFVERLLALL